MSISQFVHWIDSRTSSPENATDEGEMYPQPDGTTLETGFMVNPETGIITGYEEVWDDDNVESTDAAQLCVVLKCESNDVRGLVVKLGTFCQGFMKIGEQSSVERWELTDGSAHCVVKMGTDELPCRLALEKKFTLGEVLIVANRCWKVVEIA